MQELARQWNAIVYSFTGNDPDIQEQAVKFHAENPDNILQFGMDADLYKYIKNALK